MKIHKMRPKFHFLTNVEIKMTHLVFFFVFYCLHLEAVLWMFKILSCTH